MAIEILILQDDEWQPIGKGDNIHYSENVKARLVVGVLRDGGRASCLRMDKQDGLVIDPEMADEVANALAGSFKNRF